MVLKVFLVLFFCPDGKELFLKIIILGCVIMDGWMDEYLSLHMTGTYSYRAVRLVLFGLLFPRKTAAVRRVLTAEGRREGI